MSSGVEAKLLKKHRIEAWEIEEVIYDDSNAFSLAYQDCYFVYGQTFAGRHLIVLVRVLSAEEISKLGFTSGTNVIKIITVRDMNRNQKKTYSKKKS
jgi:uncharacterized DUF497 family protein